MNYLVIGFGSVGKRHSENLIALGNSCAIVDPDLAKIKSAVGLGYKSFSSLDNVETNCEFEAVLICSPPVFHIEQAIWALELDKKVFLEKPIGMNLSECQNLLRYDQNRIFVGYTYQWNPQYLRLKQDLNSNLIGNPYYANFVLGMNLEDWHPQEDYRKFFMSKIKLGGGALLDESHFIELAIDLFGLPEKISGLQSKVSTLEIETDDYVFIQFQYENLLLDIKLDLFKRPHESFIQLYGSDGSIICDFIKKRNTYIGHSLLSKIPSSSVDFEYERNDVFKEMIADYSVFANNKAESARVTLKRGLEVMQIIDKVREASVNRKWIFVDPK
jgi:predicted dehydrogenase